LSIIRILIRLFFRRRKSKPRWPSPPKDDTYSPRARKLVSTPASQSLSPTSETVLEGRCWVVDGDTIVIDKVHIRLAGIDAPELDHPWGKNAKWALVKLCKGQIVTAKIKPELSYDRLVAECYLSDGRDLSAEMVRSGMALDWPKFSGGKYKHLETSDARRKLWRASARQSGKLRLERSSNDS
jgi:endonuclease YncB( thermonuclease family)